VIFFDVEALDDLERIFEFNFERDPATAREHIDRIRSAVLILDAHPEIGRPAGRGSSLRELIISHGKTGYVALYEYSPGREARAHRRRPTSARGRLPRAVDASTAWRRPPAACHNLHPPCRSPELTA
jgi:plasmid stabilization system protein ParE